MKYRRLGKTNFEVSEVSLGTWQLGEGWSSVSDEDAIRVLEAALDRGINFFDTADVYGDGRSERFIAQVLAKHRGKIWFFCYFRVKFMRLAKQGSSGSRRNSAALRLLKVESGINGLLPTSWGPLHLFRFSLDQASLRAGRGDRLLRSSAVRSFLATSSQRQNKSV